MYEYKRGLIKNYVLANFYEFLEICTKENKHLNTVIFKSILLRNLLKLDL